VAAVVNDISELSAASVVVLGDVRTEAGMLGCLLYLYERPEEEGTTERSLVFELHVPSSTLSKIYGDWKRYGRGLSVIGTRSAGGINRNSRRKDKLTNDVVRINHDLIIGLGYGFAWHSPRPALIIIANCSIIC